MKTLVIKTEENKIQRSKKTEIFLLAVRKYTTMLRHFCKHGGCLKKYFPNKPSKSVNQKQSKKLRKKRNLGIIEEGKVVG